MTKPIIAIALTLVFAWRVSALPNKQEVLAAVHVVETSNDGDALSHAIPLVLDYAKESDEVVLLASPDTMPWISEKSVLSEENEQMLGRLLMGSFAAGCVDHQLKIAKTDKDPYEGWLVVIARYQRVAPKLNYKSPGIERLIALKASGGLKAYAREVVLKN